MTTSYPDADARRRSVLVAVVNNADDMRRAASEGWYRIPQQSAPRRIGAEYLALYQTGAFKDSSEAHTITYYAATRRYRLATRRELLPAEPEHPRADRYYYCIEIGPLQRLDRPVPAAKLRRITFIHTTLDRILHATDIRELFEHDDPFEQLWRALRANRLRPQKNRIVDGWPMDITLRARGGNLGIRCGDEPTSSNLAQAGPNWPTAERWEMLWLTPAAIETDLDGCLRQIGAALINLGGSTLQQDEVNAHGLLERNR